jgi:hypothetical protein
LIDGFLRPLGGHARTLLEIARLGAKLGRPLERALLASPLRRVRVLSVGPHSLRVIPQRFSRRVPVS